MSIRKQYIETLRELENISPINFYDNKQLTDLSRLTKIKNKFNTCNSYDLFIPHPKKHYSILNTDDSSSPKALSARGHGRTERSRKGVATLVALGQ